MDKNIPIETHLFLIAVPFNCKMMLSFCWQGFKIVYKKILDGAIFFMFGLESKHSISVSASAYYRIFNWINNAVVIVCWIRLCVCVWMSECGLCVCVCVCVCVLVIFERETLL